MAAADASSVASAGTVYHCLCTQTLLYLPPTLGLETLPKRTVDGSHICPLVQSLEHGSARAGMLLDSVQDSKTVVVKFEDGFEKRYLLECARCGVTVGWFLGWESFGDQGKKGPRDDVMYILPGGLMDTAEMEKGVMPVNGG